MPSLKALNPFVSMEARATFFLILVFILFLSCHFLLMLFPHQIFLIILKTGFEAATVGAIADTYAVFGLFHKIGPHTDILRRKRREITEKTIELVVNFLLSKEHLKRELEIYDFRSLFQHFDEEKLKNYFKEELLKIIENWQINLPQGALEKFLQKLPGGILRDIAIELFVDKDKIRKELQEEIKKFLLQFAREDFERIFEEIFRRLKEDAVLAQRVNKVVQEALPKIIESHHGLLEELIFKRLNELSDEEFVRIVKTASWDELQWIRINGTVLGFLIGLLLGVIQVVL